MKNLLRMENRFDIVSNSFDTRLIISVKVSFSTTEKDSGIIGTSRSPTVLESETISLDSTSRIPSFIDPSSECMDRS